MKARKQSRKKHKKNNRIKSLCRKIYIDSNIYRHTVSDKNNIFAT
ncbi:hypothetical protein NSB1T_06405 [Coprobacter fastidiosus NSB1 = JCM 33896]|nr:hypothetical protein NSB1T_06405 [Coprobacter fastidiosus NSB1 = JCM 33896]